MIGSADPAWHASFAGAVKTLSSGATLSGTVEAARIQNITAKDGIQQFTLMLSQQPDPGIPALGKLTTNAAMQRVCVISAGHIGQVVAGATQDTSIFAGVSDTRDDDGDGVLDLFDPAIDEFAQQATIGVFCVKGISGSAWAFENTNVAAYHINSAMTCLARTEPGAPPFGLAFHSFLRLQHAEADAKWTVPSRAQPALVVGNNQVIGSFLYRLS